MLRLFLERVTHDRFDLRRHLYAARRKRRRLLGQVLLHDRRNRVRFERHLTGEHLIEHHPEAVHISARVGWFVRPLLGRHVKRRAH